MKLLIIGASRGVGRVLLDRWLAEGHHATVLVRNIWDSSLSRRNLHAIRGNILHESEVHEAVKNQDAVCISIGVRASLKRIHVFAPGTRIVVDAMKRAGVSRLVCVTGIGAGDSEGHGGFFYDRILRPTLLASLYADKNQQEDVVRASGTDWTLVRPGFLTNGPYTGRYRVTTDLAGVTAGRISRADVADYLLRELTTGAHRGNSVLVDGG
jgi:putative NADH-flavin reductase